MSQVPPLNGPAMPPSTGGAPKQLVFLLHGVGADGNDLISLAPHFQEILPDALFLSPNAPEEFDMAPFGYQWFSLQDLEPDTRLKGARATAPVLQFFIQETMARFGLAEKDTVLIGFSQGACMAMHVGLRWETPFAGIISYSGIMAGPETLADEIKSRPPMLMTHGTHDPVLPVQNLDEAVAALKSVGIEPDHHRRQGLEHGIDWRCIEYGQEFLKRAFDA